MYLIDGKFFRVEIVLFCFFLVVGEKEENFNMVNVCICDNKVYGEKIVDEVFEKFVYFFKEWIRDSEEEFWNDNNLECMVFL